MVASARTLAFSSSARSSRFMWPRTLDLSTKSMAPISSPRMVTAAPSVVCELRSRTGVGQSCMMRRRASSPSIRGIFTSRVITSGCSAQALANPSFPSDAVPTTSMPGSAASMRVRACRTKVESSMTRTRIMRAPARGAAVGLLVDHRALEADGGEHVGDPRQRLRVAEEQVAARSEGLVERAHRLQDRGVGEVDEHVAAEDHVHGRPGPRSSRAR